VSLAILFQRARGWLRWLLLPPPWWVLLGVLAAIVAVSLCFTASRWGPVVSVLFEVAGASLAIAQFVSLQQNLNSGWLTRQVREWWEQRPRKREAIGMAASITLEGATARGYASVTRAAQDTPEEQLRQIWQKLGVVDSTLQRFQDDLKLQEQQFEKRLEVVRGEALTFSKAAEQRLGETITSAPLQSTVGFWLILLGLSMQAWQALP